MKNRKRNRMQGFDYSSDNLYFVTICVQDRLCCFGAVGTGRDLSLHHSNENHSNENHSNENHSNENHSNENHSNENHSNVFNKKMELNEVGQIVHDRILWLESQYQYVAMHNFVVMPNHIHLIIEIDRNKLLVPIDHALSTQREDVKIKSLSSLIGAFKTTSSKMVHQAGFLDFAWQRSFHDHIIRNEKSYFNISNYIDTNPEKWMNDTFFEKI
jgi:REP element-mobilizing transposase RayT